MKHDDARGHGAGGDCPNCGTALAGPYCHGCGQAAHLHRSIGAIWHDLLHGVLHFEGRTAATFPLLLGKPGELTRRYVHGERAKFISPMALFLMSIFLMFAVIQVAGASLSTDVGDGQGRRQAMAGMDARLASDRAALAAITAERAAALREGRPTDDLDRRQAELRGEIASLQSIRGAMDLGEDDRVNIEGKIQTGWSRLDKGLEKARANPNLVLYKVQTNAYKFSWALIPISVPLLWLMFAWRRQYRAYDHAVFVTYSLSFVTLLATALTIAVGLGLSAGTAWLIGLIVIPLHMYRQLRGAYGVGRGNAVLRTVALLVMANVAIVLFLLLLIGLGLVG